VMATEFDDQLAQLNTKLNGTYVAYGAAGRVGLMNQQMQDSNAQSAGARGGAGGRGGGAAGANSVLAERAVSKSQVLYRNGAWDLVDASKQPDFDLAKIPEDQLPEEVRKLPADQRAKFIQDKSKEREEIQSQIKDLGAKRDKVVQEKIRAQGLKSDESLDTAVRQSIQSQAKKAGLEITSEK